MLRDAAERAAANAATLVQEQVNALAAQMARERIERRELEAALDVARRQMESAAVGMRAGEAAAQGVDLGGGGGQWGELEDDGDVRRSRKKKKKHRRRRRRRTPSPSESESESDGGSASEYDDDAGEPLGALAHDLPPSAASPLKSQPQTVAPKPVVQQSKPQPKPEPASKKVEKKKETTTPHRDTYEWRAVSEGAESDAAQSRGMQLRKGRGGSTEVRIPPDWKLELVPVLPGEFVEVQRWMHISEVRQIVASRLGCPIEQVMVWRDGVDLAYGLNGNRCVGMKVFLFIFCMTEYFINLMI